jgi:hypothetical protein
MKWCRLLAFGVLLAGLLLSAGREGLPATPDCPDLPLDALPPGLGGPADAIVDSRTAQRWIEWRRAREVERMREAWEPEVVRAKYRRIDQMMIDRGCVDTNQVVDLGRALFLRRFTADEGRGGNLAGNLPRPLNGVPLAHACADCHWRGGQAGAGDRIDNAFAGGDGRTATTMEELQAPSLWGSGWVDLLAGQMSRDLAALRSAAVEQARSSGRVVRVKLVSQDVDFGYLTVRPRSEDGEVDVDTSEVVGVAEDLRIRPFGWRGRYQTLREAVAAELDLRLGLQVAAGVSGNDRPSDRVHGERGAAAIFDPDDDGVVNEFMPGQVTSLVSYLATLTPPVPQVPQQGPRRGEPMTAELDLVPSNELTMRWGLGARTFQAIGCARCHRPMLEVNDSRFALADESFGRGAEASIDLALEGARPQLIEREGSYAVPLHSDLKMHSMGASAAQPNAVTGERSDDRYLTRPLWGMALTGPWMHDGRATTLDEAIALHGGDGSDAKASAQSFSELSTDEQNALRTYLMALQKPPAIRVR